MAQQNLKTDVKSERPKEKQGQNQLDEQNLAGGHGLVECMGVMFGLIFVVLLANLCAGAMTPGGNPVRPLVDASLSIPVICTPEMTIDKDSTTTLVEQAGQVVPYTYLVTNTGNQTLTNVVVTDATVDVPPGVTCDWTGSSGPATAAGTLSPGETVMCSAERTVTEAEFQAGGPLVNIACADSDQTEPVCDDLGIPILTSTGQITPTGTTCSDFTGGIALDLDEAFYGLKSGEVNNVAPGVFFYYMYLTAEDADFTVEVKQTRDLAAWTPMNCQKENQIIVYDSTCTRVGVGDSPTTYTASCDWPATGNIEIDVTGATVGEAYVIGIKYSLNSLVENSAQGEPMVAYTFETSVDGVVMAMSADSIEVKPKHTTASPAPAAPSVVPKVTKLGLRYPNPSNPDTWIPFQLAEDARVSIEIYDVTGRLVRTLNLGQYPAGYYLDKSRAAYWDGCNESGEGVASGIYFYRFTAGDFSAMKRMVILK
jgi:uncharacterized repeat protein (TIGR01451 family)